MNPALQKIMDRIAVINKRIQWIAEEEARSAVAGSGKAAEGYFSAEKMRLIDETDGLLDRAEQLLGMV